jgi:hypothetical protein
MAAHSQFCSYVAHTHHRTRTRTKTLPTPKTRTRSGDYTLTATELAIRELEKEEADEHFVIVVSDANLRRYGISPRTVRPHLGSPQRHTLGLPSARVLTPGSLVAGAVG